MRENLVFLVLSLLLLACDPCDECGDPLVSEPTVRMVFINVDSIEAIDSTLIVYNEIDSSLTANTDSLFILRDSLNILTDSIANGGSLEEELNSIEMLISDREEDSIFFAEENVGLDSISTILSSTRTSINTGLMLLSAITIPEISQTITFTDSATSWNIPLSFEKAFTLYELTIEDQVYTVELDYENFTEVDEERNIRIRAENVEVINHSFINLDPCVENCTDGNTTLTFDF